MVEERAEVVEAHGVVVEPGCEDCPPGIQEPPDTGPFGISATLVHGVSGRRAIVALSVAHDKPRHIDHHDRTVAPMKRAARRKHRRAWRVWTQDPTRPEPDVAPLTSWEVW